MASRASTLAMSLAVGCQGAASMLCPASPAWVHAWAEVEVVASTSCDAIRAEIQARVNGQPIGWHDPHNNGTYSVLPSSADTLQLQRVTGNQRFTDKMTITLEHNGASCKISACSQSQVTSIADFSTNYCNLRMLYCSVDHGCAALTSQYELSSEFVQTSLGAGRDPLACMKTTAVAAEATTGGSQDRMDAAARCILMKCPILPKTLAPSAACVLAHCGKDAGKCLLDRSCRQQAICSSKCTKALPGTPAASVFLDLQGCIKDNCPDLPPSPPCVALHCAVPAAACAVNEECRHALECSDACKPSVLEDAPADMFLLPLAEDAPGNVPAAAVMTVTAAEEATTGGSQDRMDAAAQCILMKCPILPKTLAPSAACVLAHCGKDAGKCLLDRSCRQQAICSSKCTKALPGTPAASVFLDLQGCIKDNCPDLPPSPPCVALHCAVPAAACAVNEECRHALECSDACKPSVLEDAPADMLLLPLAENVPSNVPAAAVMECINRNCPRGADMSPSIPCVLTNCGLDVGKCAVHSDCRGQLLCTSKCTAPLAHDDDRSRFLDLQACVREQCIGFPPDFGCVAMHCGLQTAGCAFHSKCRTALECASDCTASTAVQDVLTAINTTTLVV